MTDRSKIEAVREYLQQEFPGAVIDEQYRAERGAHLFEMQWEGAGYRAAVKEEFFEGREPAHIPEALTRFTLVEHLRDLPETLLVVTDRGLSLEE